MRKQSAVELARSKITQVLSNLRLPPPNLSPEEKKALQELRSDQTIRIMRADKGNCTVIMEKKDYDDKIMHLLNDRNAYQILPVGDKSIEITKKRVNKLVYGFAKENKITTSVYHQLKCDKAVSPKFYGLPKIHKSDIPLRPIVSFIGAPTYCLAKFLVGILSPLLSLEYTIQNSRQFERLINNFQCLSDECLVSFDVVSLFTSISVPETLTINFNLLMFDNLLHERTNLTASDVIKCAELCLHSTVFSFNDSLQCWDYCHFHKSECEFLTYESESKSTKTQDHESECEFESECH